MKKQLKPAKKTGFETADKNEEIIDLKDVVNKNHVNPDHNKEDLLNLTDKISSKEQKRAEAGVLELTETIPPFSNPVEDEDDLQDESSSNVIHLSEMTSGLSADESNEIEELSIEDIVELDDKDFDDLKDENLDQLTERLESVFADSFDEDDDIFKASPDINLVNMDDLDSSDEDDEKDDMDGFDLLSEVEADMTGNIDAIDVKELNDGTTFKDIGSVLAEELNDLTSSGDGIDSDENFSEAALALNRAMQADRDNVYQDEDEDEDELLEEIESVRDKLDNVFYEEDSQDLFSAFNTTNNFKQENAPGNELNELEDEIDEFDNDKLISQPFDEDESDEAPLILNSTSFDDEVILKNPDGHPDKTDQTDLFDFDINLSDVRTSKDQSLQNEIEPSKSGVAVSDKDIESALIRLIETKYSKKIEQMIIEAVEKTILSEIAKIKDALLDKTESIDISQ